LVASWSKTSSHADFLATARRSIPLTVSRTGEVVKWSDQFHRSRHPDQPSARAGGGHCRLRYWVVGAVLMRCHGLSRRWVSELACWTAVRRRVSRSALHPNVECSPGRGWAWLGATPPPSRMVHSSVVSVRVNVP